MKLAFHPKENERILRLRLRLRASHPVRQAVERLLEGQESLEDIKPLLATLADPVAWKWRERLLVAWVLGHAQLDAHQKSAAAATLTTVLSGKRAEKGRGLLALKRALYLELLLLLYYAWVNSSRGDWGDPLSDLIVFVPSTFLVVLGFTIPVSAAIEDGRAERVRTMAAFALGNVSQPESVGVLAAALLDDSAAVSRVARESYEVVLPALTTSHYRQLPSGAIFQLCRVLSHKNEALVVETLEALGKVGDGSALSTVERLASNPRPGRIQEAAAHILPILRERQRHEIAQATLLRASDLGVAGLLRASEPGTEAGVEPLLRAHSGEENQE